MLSFKQFLQDLFESKHSVQSHEDPLKVLNSPGENYIRKIHALRGVHKGAGHGEEHYGPHITRMKKGNQWEMIGAISHPESHNFFDDDDHKRLSGHPNKKVRDAYEKRFGAGATKPAEPKSTETKPAEPKAAPKPKVEKVAKPVKAAEPKAAPKPKAAEPTKPSGEAKKSGSFSVQKGDTDDFAYSTHVSHVTDHKGKKVGSVVSLRIPSEYGQDRVHHVAYSGNHEKGGLKELGSHGSHIDAMKALGSHLKGK